MGRSTSIRMVACMFVLIMLDQVDGEIMRTVMCMIVLITLGICVHAANASKTEIHKT